MEPGLAPLLHLDPDSPSSFDLLPAADFGQDPPRAEIHGGCHGDASPIGEPPTDLALVLPPLPQTGGPLDAYPGY